MSEKPLDFLKTYALERRDYGIQERSRNFDPIFQAAWGKYTPKMPDPSGKGDLDLPELWLRTEILVANILAPFYGFAASPLQPYGDIHQTHQRADKIGMLWDYRCRQMEIDLKWPNLFRQNIVCGSSVATMMWEIRHDFVSKTKPLMVMGMALGRHTKRYYEEVYNGPQCSIIDIMTFWVDPDAKSCNLDEAVDCGVERWMSMEELYRLIEQGYFSPEGYKIDWDKTEPRHGSSGTSLQLHDPANAAMGTEPLGLPSDKARRKEVKVTEWWGRYLLPGTRIFVPMVVTVADPDGQKILLRPWGTVPKFGNNPFNHGRKPFVMMNYVERPFSPWGQGLYEITASTDEAYQTKVNARLKNIALLLNKMYAYNPNEIRNVEQLVSRPGGLIEVTGDPRKALYPLDFQDLLMSLSAQIFEFRSLYDEISGVNALMRSGNAGEGKTPVSALEVNAKQEMAGQRFKFLVGIQMKQGPVKLADMELSLESQFLTQPTQMSKLKQDGGAAAPSPEFFEITPEDLEGKFKYQFVADPLQANAMMKINQKITIMGLLSNRMFQVPSVPGVVQPWYAAQELLKIGDIPWQNVLIPEQMALQQMLARFTQEAQQQAAQGAMALAAPMLANQQAMQSQDAPPGKTNDKGRPVSPVPGSSIEGTPGLPPVPSQDNPAGAAAAPIENGGVMA